MQPLPAIGFAWLAWVVSWALAAMWVNRTVAKPVGSDELRSRLTVGTGAALLFWGFRDAPGYTGAFGWSLFAVVVLGFVFAWWARLHLGRLWSGRVTRKEGHRVVNTGPYAIVRHPIYTGIIVSAFAAGIAERRWLALLGAVVIAAGFWLRARLEERFLTTELGPAYEAYKRQVPMLIPFCPRTR
jgi:protein-S-isoprenylcysteine O-methyltransferase Ste14